MPSTTITNPAGAYGQTATGPQTVDHFTVGTAVTANTLVKVAADGTIAPLTDGANNGVGVALETHAAGERCPVVTRGLAHVVSATSFSAAAKLIGASGGKAEDSGSDETASVHAVCVALEAAGAGDATVAVWVY
jgi:hypothetical protein